jgi:Domain of unknown function (DUF4383)
MDSAVNRTDLSKSTRWSPARLYLVVSGAFLLVVAVAGFAVNHSFPIGRDQVEAAGTGHLLGILETNGWHNLAGLFSGLVALGFATRPRWARFGALLKGAFYVVVTTSIAIWGGETFWIATNDADQVVHASLAIGGVVSGLLTQPRGVSRP